MRSILLIFSVGLCAGCAGVSGGAEPLPQAKKIKSISIEFNDRKLGDVEFTPTSADWTAIRAQMLPAKPDAMPSKWRWLGTVKMVQVDGKPFHVELYRTKQGRGAFAAGKSYEERTYYRGGDDSGIVKALLAAYKKSKTKSE